MTRMLIRFVVAAYAVAVLFTFGPLRAAETDAAALPEPKGEVILDDHFDHDDPADKEDIGNEWTTNSAWRAKGHKQVDLIDGAMHATRHPEADHGVAIFHKMDFRDATVDMRFKLDDKADSLGLDFVDRDLKTVHAGHLCMARVQLNQVSLQDSKTGVMNLEIHDRRQAGKETPEDKALLKTKTKAFKLDLEAGTWHTMRVTVEGDVMSVAIDGKPVGAFQSEGIGHPTKHMITLAVGKSAWVDDVKVWRLKGIE
ncbi:MAG: DUF1080 domain-containing protein [Phycisphaera sp.]|nr:DUF1080 domain-containing protein [Phycisphaera sp.]